MPRTHRHPQLHSFPSRRSKAECFQQLVSPCRNSAVFCSSSNLLADSSTKDTVPLQHSTGLKRKWGTYTYLLDYTGTFRHTESGLWYVCKTCANAGTRTLPVLPPKSNSSHGAAKACSYGHSTVQPPAIGPTAEGCVFIPGRLLRGCRHLKDVLC